MRAAKRVAAGIVSGTLMLLIAWEFRSVVLTGLALICLAGVVYDVARMLRDLLRPEDPWDRITMQRARERLDAQRIYPGQVIDEPHDPHVRFLQQPEKPWPRA